MPITDDIRRTLTDPKPLYFAAGVLDKIRAEAPERIAAVRATDPKEVQSRLSKQAKETQARVSETLDGLDTDIKKLREQATSLAMQGVGFAAEYAVKAREAYDELADRGRGAVQSWRGEEQREAPRYTVERESVQAAEPQAEKPGDAAEGAKETKVTKGTNPASGRRTTTARTTTSGTTSTGRASAAEANGSGNGAANGTRKTPPKS